MRTTKDYNKLVEGYSFSLSILKKLKPKFYNRIMRTKNLFDLRGDNFMDFIRNLRVDFINAHDEKDAGIPLISTFDFGLFQETVSLNYLPNEGYTLGMMYEKDSPLRSVKIFCEIFPTTLKDIEENNIARILRISTLKEIENKELEESENNSLQAKKVVNFIAGITEDSLVILVQDLDKPKAVKEGLEIPLNEIDKIYEDLTNMF